ncbi:hypothetical protein DY000_02048513 [Brassica cretica]|uniref:Uncharacterized protein n=1 Tax=Brassica cretica TaxID=69181 RepID=A0ABQ7EQD0_BRACR|nr:hypothetical protein DY000_02048513 [Brassica cretica]
MYNRGHEDTMMGYLPGDSVLHDDAVSDCSYRTLYNDGDANSLVSVTTSREITFLLDGRNGQPAVEKPSIPASVFFGCWSKAIRSIPRTSGRPSGNIDRVIFGHLWSGVSQTPSWLSLDTLDFGGCRQNFKIYKSSKEISSELTIRGRYEEEAIVRCTSSAVDRYRREASTIEDYDRSMYILYHRSMSRREMRDLVPADFKPKASPNYKITPDEFLT